MSSGRRPGRYFVETWGCQMNEHDSRRMAGQLERLGLVAAADAADADLILLNSCSVRERAEQKVYSRLGEYRLWKRARPDLRIGLCGCVAQQVGERALSRVPELDFVLGPARVGELADLLPRLAAGERFVATGFPGQRRHELDSVARADEFKGMVTAIEGCDKRCTFCIVPSTRGAERCRPLADVVADARRLLERGLVEIELLGQTVNHWREPGGEADFADLLGAVAALPGLRRLRFVTSYPRDFTPRMIERLRLPVVADYLHLPVQSGSDRTLRRMGRGYTAAEYLDLAARIRAVRPTVALSTDVIVGFPGETDTDFEATLALVERVRFAALYAFCFSPRPGTAALRLPDPVPAEIAAERLQRLLALQDGIQTALNRELVGRRLEVLVTGAGKRQGELVGRTSCHRIVHFEATRADPATPATDATGALSAAPRPGSLATVHVTRALPHSLLGELLSPEAHPGAGAPPTTGGLAQGQGQRQGPQGRRPRLPIVVA